MRTVVQRQAHGLPGAAQGFVEVRRDRAGQPGQAETVDCRHQQRAASCSVTVVTCMVLLLVDTAVRRLDYIEVCSGAHRVGPGSRPARCATAPVRRRRASRPKCSRTKCKSDYLQSA